MIEYIEWIIEECDYFLHPSRHTHIIIIDFSPFLNTNPLLLTEVFDSFRYILQEGEVEKRTQYVIEQLFAVRRSQFQEYPRMAPELDLVEEGDQITHKVGLDDVINKEEYLDVFHVEEKYEENEETWRKIKATILGEESDDDDDDDVSDEEEEEEEEGESDEEEGDEEST